MISAKLTPGLNKTNEMEKLDLNNNYKFQLRYKFGTLKKAAKTLKIPYTQLSRILHGHYHVRQTNIKIRIAAGELQENIKYLYPREDWETFKIINKIK
jgi:hypothetical protein